jgi:hypothetical protein
LQAMIVGRQLTPSSQKSPGWAEPRVHQACGTFGLKQEAGVTEIGQCSHKRVPMMDFWIATFFPRGEGNGEVESPFKL